VSDHLSQSTCLEILHPKTDEHVNTSVELHHLVGKLSTIEILLTEVQPTVSTGFLVINVCKVKDIVKEIKQYQEKWLQHIQRI